MNKLAYMRTKRGLTQKRLSELTGLSIQSISNYECGYLKLEKTTYNPVRKAQAFRRGSIREEGFNEYCSSFLLGLMSENK